MRARLLDNSQSFSALRSGNFRLYMFGQLISLSGTWMQSVAQGFLVFNLTHSEAWLGYVALAAGLPLIIMSPVAGVVLERIPRRRLLMGSQMTQMLLAFILTALTVTNTVQVGHVIVLAFLLGMTNAFDVPSRQSFVLEMVGREDLQSGIALNSILNSVTRFLGPTLAGVALAQLGVVWCFFINGLSFLVVIICLVFVKVPYAIPSGKKAGALQQLREGFAFVRGNARIRSLLLLTATVGLFSIPILQIFPAFADTALRSPKEGYAALMAAQGLGSILGGFFVGWMALRWGRGWLIVVSVICATIFTILMALQTEVWSATLFSALAGLFLLLEVVSLNTLIQLLVPDTFRGRVLSLYALAFLGLAPIGALVLGWLAELMGASVAIALYGVVSGVLGIAIIVNSPNFLQQEDVVHAEKV
jgi:MFS family permease